MTALNTVEHKLLPDYREFPMPFQAHFMVSLLSGENDIAQPTGFLANRWRTTARYAQRLPVQSRVRGRAESDYFPASPPRTGRAPFSASGSPFKRWRTPLPLQCSAMYTCFWFPSSDRDYLRVDASGTASYLALPAGTEFRH